MTVERDGIKEKLEIAEKEIIVLKFLQLKKDSDHPRQLRVDHEVDLQRHFSKLKFALSLCLQMEQDVETLAFLVDQRRSSGHRAPSVLVSTPPAPAPQVMADVAGMTLKIYFVINSKLSWVISPDSNKE